MTAGSEFISATLEIGGDRVCNLDGRRGTQPDGQHDTQQGGMFDAAGASIFAVAPAGHPRRAKSGPELSAPAVRTDLDMAAPTGVPRLHDRRLRN